MIYGILGDLEVRATHGGLVALPAGHHRSVLAALLVRANQQLSTAELLRAGWRDPGVNPAQLHKAVSAVRRLVAEAGRPGAIKTRNRFGYELQATDDDLDMLRFRRCLEQADAERRARRSAAEIYQLREALRLWRGGRPLANVRNAPFAADLAALRSRRKRAAVRLFALEIGRGQHRAILDELAGFVAGDPADGQLCRQLMVALYRSGHAGEAATVLERHEEATGNVDRDLRRLGYAMARRDDEAVARAESVGARTVNASPLPRQLPPVPAHFVGRADALAEVRALLRDARTTVAVISGPGGVGKSALALRVAHDLAALHPDGQLWAELRGSSDRPADPGEVLAEFLRALGEPAVPQGRRERVSLFRSLAAARRLLVVLDDAADGTQIRDLIPGGDGCAVLVTARRRLPGIDAGVRHARPLSALDHPTASALFRNVVEAAGADVSGEAEAVEAIVRLCGGLPLALRIAAQLRVEDLHRPAAALLDRLRRQGAAGFRYGGDSLARTLEAGVASLGDRARRLLLGLGLLALPTFGEWTAVALLEEPAPAAGAALTQLAQAGLIDTIGPGPRYAFSELTREYARHQAGSEGVAAPRRVFRALLTCTHAAHHALQGGHCDVGHSPLPDVPVPAAELAVAASTPRAWFEAERAGIRAAVAQAGQLGLTEECWDLAVSAHEFYALGGHFDDWRATHEIALRECRRAGDPRGEGMVLVALGQPALVASGSPGVSAVPDLERAVTLLRQVGERRGEAVALRTLANALRRRGELARPLRLFTEALGHHRAGGDRVGAQQTLRFVGQTELDAGDPDAAVATLREAERVARELGGPRMLAPTLYWLGRALLAHGEAAAAAAAFDEIAVMFAGGGLGLAYAMHGLGLFALATGDLGTAEARLAEAGILARGGGDLLLEGRVQLSVAALHAARDGGAGQESALTRAAELFRRCGAVHLEQEARRGRSSLARGEQ